MGRLEAALRVRLRACSGRQRHDCCSGGSSAVAYPIVYAAKPFFSWQAFIPMTFELGVLFAALTCLLGMLHFNRLPCYYHPVFRSERFDRVTDDRFFVSIESSDPKFDPDETAAFLKDLGATHIEMVED
jgi:predicted small integral membrane protein